MAAWLTLDPARPLPPAARRGETVPEAYARWALDAPLLAVRRAGEDWQAPPGVSFRDWLAYGEKAVPDHPPPTRDDLEYHLSTLFPPVRPRGFLEVRYLDAQPGDAWVVPVAVVAALTQDARCAEAALDACAGVRGRWWDAARHGVRDRALGRAALTVLSGAAEALRRLPGHEPLAESVERFTDRWTSRGRSPADDLSAHPTRLEEISC
jgi:glutamate--cysteine ligase